ncbi:hypothetical protein RA307_30765 [Xanthobacteraceae bacterium Astr-EGSB]|uniref:hypothetical protein n=1 Tax=Astrobacterium formosum TaxID=3069710 RepID=UPI0027B654A8|nr:hypothetical protein [Xanthobacteraceae bacterium Astr-EGSB]
MTISGTTQTAGQLVVWTDVDPAYDEDFNRWYDREHMGERVGIPGFVWARRYRAVSGGRPYLALYRTQSLAVFHSAPYQKAFQNQTSWSLTNFARMRDTVRRVGTVDVDMGAGTGGALGLVHLPKLLDAAAIATVRAKMAETLAADGVLSGHVLTPDAELSTPLSASGPVTAPSDTLVFIEATNEPAAAAAVRTISDALDMPGVALSTFTLLWELAA